MAFAPPVSKRWVKFRVFLHVHAGELVIVYVHAYCEGCYDSKRACLQYMGRGLYVCLHVLDLSVWIHIFEIEAMLQDLGSSSLFGVVGLTG